MAEGSNLRLLLDSHVLLWALLDDPRLRSEAREAIGDPANEVSVSAASIWELEIKLTSRKLRIEVELLDEAVRVGYTLLAAHAQHGVTAARLPLHHRDPFDRMLIAQAQLEGLTLVTRDLRFEPYGIPTLAA
jgi:PIN domain nuclease of toxin-antitoxin system